MKFRLDFQSEIDVLTKSELDESLRAAHDGWARSLVAGVSPKPMPQLRGTADAGALLLGSQDTQIGPRAGYAWAVMRLGVSGLATGDVVAFYLNGTANTPLWQVTAASPFATFSKLQLTLRGGDQLVAANAGTFTSTSLVTVSGEIIELPEVMLPKLAI